MTTINKDLESYVSDIMTEASNFALEGHDKEVVLNKVLDSSAKEVPHGVNINYEQAIEDVFAIHDRLKIEKASNKKIKRMMETPLNTYRKFQYVNHVRQFIYRIEELAYQGYKRPEIEEKLNNEGQFIAIMNSKQHSLVSLRKSMPKLIQIIREMKSKDKDEDEIKAFLEKHLFSLIKLS